MVISSDNEVMPLVRRQPGLGCWHQLFFVEVRMMFGELAIGEAQEGCCLAFARKHQTGLPHTLLGEDDLDFECFKLMLVGARQTRGLAREPGAYLAHQGKDLDDTASASALPGWSLQKLASGDKLGLALVERWMPRGHGADVSFVGLAFVHNGRVVGGRWFHGWQAKKSMDYSRPRLVLELPLTSQGGTVTCLPNSAVSSPSLDSLLDALGDVPQRLHQAEANT